jgi:hypothetical protein
MSLLFVGHPKETDLALFAGGELGPLARWRIEKHLQHCDRCQGAVADFFHLHSEFSELGELPAVDWEHLAQRIREGVEAAGDTAEEPSRGPLFQPLIWRFGVATATVLCAFIVVRQFPLHKPSEENLAVVTEQKETPAKTAPAGDRFSRFEEVSEPASEPQELVADLKKEADAAALGFADVAERGQYAQAKEKQAASEDALPGDVPGPAAPAPSRQIGAQALAAEQPPAAAFRSNALREEDEAAGEQYRAKKSVTDELSAAPRKLAEARRDDSYAEAREGARTLEGASRRSRGFVSDEAKADMDRVQAVSARPAEAPVAEGGAREVRARQEVSSSALAPIEGGLSIMPASADDAQVDVGVMTDGGLQFRAVDSKTGNITITYVYAR